VEPVMVVDQSIDKVPIAPARSGTEVALSVSGLGKMYRIYDQPKDRLKLMLLARFGRSYGHEFWALRNVSFEVRRGESLGIIGRNGSGKSTLLQIIAGTLKPSSGEVRVNGRVAALLELGSGFNPEFTGRENVFMNGTILGLSRNEVEGRFDEIAAFADIGQFMDQPVKLYSSGMVVRLAFAVQTFVPKEVLIIDEALAVGDEAFQRKCMASLEKFRDAGGTVLLVSHNIQTVVRQCQRCLLLSQGEFLADGPSKPVTDLYQKLMYSDPGEFVDILAILRQGGLQAALSQFRIEESTHVQSEESPQVVNCSSSTQADPIEWFDPNMPQTAETRYGNGDAEIIAYGMFNQQGERLNVLVTGRRYAWVYKVQFHRDAYDVSFGMMLRTMDGLDVSGISSQRERTYFHHIATSSILRVSFSIKLNVVPGTYFLNAGVDGIVNGERTFLQRRVDICMIRVLSCDARDPYGLAYLEPQLTVEPLGGPVEIHRTD
jgi:lipopolysaccharide transport system ATP-binding protein